MKKTLKKLSLIVAVLLVATLVYGCICYLVKDTKRFPSLNCITVNERTGDIAVSYYEDPYAVVKVFDSDGNEKFFTRLYNNGKSIHQMIYSDDDFLYADIFMKEKTAKFDENGNMTYLDSDENVEYPRHWSDEWEKHGTSYVKQVDNIIYCYDYANFFEYYWKPETKLYIKNEAGEEKIIITDRE